MIDEQIKYHAILSKNIRKFRIAAKLSQEKMAEKLGCSREFISRVENQRERISLTMLFKIAELFKINPSRLLSQI